MASLQKIAPCLWFDNEAEEAAKFYVSVFEKDSGVDRISRYTKEGFEFHGRPEGAVLTVEFRLFGQTFTALNGGPQFKFSEAISLQVLCDTQDEIDHYWRRLTDGGSESMCGWLKDRFGLSWQIVPTKVREWLTDADPARVQRVSREIFKMRKLDLATLERAYRG